MSERDDTVYLGHMLDIARSAADKTSTIGRDVFDANDDLRFALTYMIQIIGEAASHVSSATRDAHPEIPWQEIIGMRHRVVHDYLNVDYEIVWDVVRNRIPQLIEQLEPLVPPDED